MRVYRGTITIDGSATPLGTAKIIYPDTTVFIFNPLFFEIEVKGIVRSMALSVSDVYANGYGQTMDISLCNGKAKVYYSRFLQLFFDNPKQRRAKELHIELKAVCGDYAVTVLDFTHIAIWGAISLGDDADPFGVFKYNSVNSYWEQTRIWFKKFPFSLTLFRPLATSSDSVIETSLDHSPFAVNTSVIPPAFSKIIEMAPATESASLTTAIEDIAYSILTGKFYAIAGGKYYNLWDKYGNFYPNTSYNTSNGALTNKKWWNLTDGRFYHVDGPTGELVEESLGCGGETGLYEVDPSITFPSARRVCAYKQKPSSSTLTLFSTFDYTFDYTFFCSREFTAISIPIITNLVISEQESGYYLRWIDRLGRIQYFLFTKGEETIKNKKSGNEIREQDLRAGMWFPNQIRDIHIDGTITRMCCATSLTDQIYAYVSSITTSPVIDLYMGKSKYGEEIWCPVNIVEGNHKYKHKDSLHDLEIGFTMPSLQSQTL